MGHSGKKKKRLAGFGGSAPFQQASKPFPAFGAGGFGAPAAGGFGREGL